MSAVEAPTNTEVVSAPVVTKEAAVNGIVPEELVVNRFADAEGNNGKPYRFEKTALKKKNDKAPERYALNPEKLDFKKEENQKKMIEHLGFALTCELAYQRWKGMSNGWTGSATKEVKDAKGNVVSAEFNTKEFEKYASEFSARGETIKSLLLEKDELTMEIIKLSKNPPKNADGSTDSMAISTRMMEIGQRMQEITETIEFKKREGKEDDEEDAKPAETAPATAVAA